MPYSILAMDAKPILIGVGALCAAVIVLALIIGCVKGIRRVSWSGLVWLVAGAAFFLLTKDDPKPTTATYVIAGVCIVATLVLYGVCSLYFRPHEKWVKREGDRFNSDEYGILYDEEYYDYDDYEEYETRKMLVMKGMGTPSIFGRIFGGLVCALNAAMAVFAVAGTAFLLLSTVEQIKQGALAVIFNNVYVTKIGAYVSAYAMDMLAIGIIVFVACMGYEKGLIESFRAVFVKLGAVVAVIGSFYVPFSPFAEKGAVGTVLGKFIAAAQQIGLNGKVASIAGKLIMGVAVCAVAIVIVFLINKGLEKLAETIEDVSFLSIMDGSLSCIIYIVIGVAVCIAVWVVFFMLGYYGIFNPLELFTEDSLLSSGIYDLVAKYVAPILDKINVGKLIDKIKK